MQTLRSALPAVVAASLLAVTLTAAQQPALRLNPQPVAEDRGAAALERHLRQLATNKRVLDIVAHPDDEDGGLLTWLSRVAGARVTLLTLTRGEGGQNAMGSETYDALGLMRTQELLKAGQSYGVEQMFGTEADFGFSKTQEESFSRWGHERVLYDAVLAVRRTRPQVIVSTFVGGITDGHGHHQVAGEIAQEAFRAAADPHVFPEQLRDGLTVWQADAVYSMTPFAPVTAQGMFDYATGKWAAARFKNHVNGSWTEGALSADVTINVGERDGVLGRSPAQIAREGWGEQRSQYGGGNPSLSGPAHTSYHLWAVAPAAAGAAQTTSPDLFSNSKVHIDTHLQALASVGSPQWLARALAELDGAIASFVPVASAGDAHAAAHQLAAIERQTQALRVRVEQAELPADEKSQLATVLGWKLDEMQALFADLLGLDMLATRARAAVAASGRVNSADEMPATVMPGEEFVVRVHTAAADPAVELASVSLASHSGSPWKFVPAGEQKSVPDAERFLTVQCADNAVPTEPYFHRPTIEQPYYDLSDAALRGAPLGPEPLEALVEFRFEGISILLRQPVQALVHLPGHSGSYLPLAVVPAVGVRMETAARILPIDGKPLPVRVLLHAQGAVEGVVRLDLPAGWKAEPAELPFHSKAAGDLTPLEFAVQPAAGSHGEQAIKAVACVGAASYQSGWQSVGYPGLLPTSLYRPATMRTRAVDLRIARKLRVAYVMGTGDPTPEALEALGVPVHMLSASELAAADLSAWETIVVGIRAYGMRADLSAAEARLEAFVRAGGTVVVQYQGEDFPAPLPIRLGRASEKVVEESAPVRLLAPQDRLLSWPNQITAADFEGWVEERGHSFAGSWDAQYRALTETADEGQDVQRGGLLAARLGKGQYIYVSYALYRQLPELVPGSYRLLANLISAGHEE